MTLSNRHSYIARPVILSLLLGFAGCPNENHPRHAAGPTPPPSIKQGTTIDNNEKRVAEFKDFASTLVQALQEEVHGEVISQEHRGAKLEFKLEISDDYSIDVKKSDSLVSPYSGEVRIKTRQVMTKLTLLGAREVTDFKQAEWQPYAIKCAFQDGKWHAISEIGSLIRLNQPEK